MLVQTHIAHTEEKTFLAKLNNYVVAPKTKKLKLFISVVALNKIYHKTDKILLDYLL